MKPGYPLITVAVILGVLSLQGGPGWAYRYPARQGDSASVVAGEAARRSSATEIPCSSSGLCAQPAQPVAAGGRRARYRG